MDMTDLELPFTLWLQYIYSDTRSCLLPFLPSSPSVVYTTPPRPYRLPSFVDILQ